MNCKVPWTIVDSVTKIFISIKIFPYINSSVDQAYSVKVAEYWHCMVMGLDAVLVHKRAKKTWPISSHLDLRLGQYR